MAFICENCGKSIQVGRTQSHGRGVAGKRWKKRAHMTSRTFKTNVQKIGVLVGGKKVSMNICAKCIKKFKKEDGKVKFFTQSVTS